VTVPVKDDSDARYAAVKLGELLADITMSLSATEIHAMIVTRLRRSDYDARLARLVAGASEFANLWNALVQGVPAPAMAWETVALPTVVAFSNPKTLKARLELATSLWLVIHNASEEELAERAEGWAPEPHDENAELVTEDQPFGPSRMLNLFPTENLGPSAPKRRWSRSLITLALVLATAAGGLWWFVQEPTSGKDQSSAQSPIRSDPRQQTSTSAQPTASPTALPAAGDTSTDKPPSTSVPPPSVSWTGEGPAVAPTAPHGLAVRNILSTGVALSWQPPVNPGSGGVSYYRIFVDGTNVGWTDVTRAPIRGLTSGVTYSFSVVAYNGAGLASPPSEVVTATTLAPSPAPSTGPPAPSPVVGTDPSGSIALGNSFAVYGSGLPCAAPARVRVFLGGQPVAAADLDSKGSFSAAIPVDNTNPAMPRFTVMTSGEQVVLTTGAWPIVVKLASQGSCTVTANYSTQVSFH
jgi:hypothetical protein